MAGALGALRNALARVLRPLAARGLVRPGKLEAVAEFLRPRRMAQLPRPKADRLLPDAVTGWLGDRASTPEEEEETPRPHEADLPDALAGGDGLPVQHAVLVAVPVEIAYNQFTQFEDFPRFMRTIARAEQIDGVQVELEFRRWGLRRSWRAHVVDQRPEERIAWRSVRGLGLAGVTTFHPIADRLTRVDVSVVVEPAGGVPAIARRLGLVDRAVAGELNRFKAFVEMREEETGAWRGYVADGEVVDEQDYFGWEPEEEGSQDAPREDAQGAGSDPGEDAGTEAPRAEARRGRAASREASKAETTDRASQSNGASAGQSEKGAGGTRANKQTGGSRTRA